MTIYQTSQKFHVNIRVIKHRFNFSDSKDQDRLINSRLVALNGGIHLNNPNQLGSLIQPPDPRFLFYEKKVIPIDVKDPVNLIYLKHTYAQRNSLTAMTFEEYCQLNSKMTIGLSAKRSGHMVLSVYPVSWFTQNDELADKIVLVNVLETFDFDKAKVDVTVYFKTKQPLSETDLKNLARSTNGSMSDGWGEEYFFEDDDVPFCEVSGWRSDDRIPKIKEASNPPDLLQGKSVADDLETSVLY